MVSDQVLPSAQHIRPRLSSDMERPTQCGGFDLDQELLDFHILLVTS